MSQKAATGVFDVEAFVDEVERYRVRRGRSIVEMCDVIGMATSTYKRIIAGVQPPGLRIVCLLADECDLSLDKYRLDRCVSNGAPGILPATPATKGSTP